MPLGCHRMSHEYPCQFYQKALIQPRYLHHYETSLEQILPVEKTDSGLLDRVRMRHYHRSLAILKIGKYQTKADHQARLVYQYLRSREVYFLVVVNRADRLRNVFLGKYSEIHLVRQESSPLSSSSVRIHARKRVVIFSHS